MPENNSSKSIFFPNLDGLRFIAFFIVFMYHSLWYLGPKNIGEYPIHKFLFTLNGQGNFIGVNFFFVLSGFLITYLLLKELKNQGQVHVLKFYMRRLLRIWPLYFASLIAVLVLFPHAFSTGTSNALYYFTFLANFDHVYNQLPDLALLGVQWSVCIEEQFYLVWPLLFLIVPRKLLPLTFGIVVIGSIAFAFFHAQDKFQLYYNTLSCMGDLAIGGILALLALNERFLSMLSSLPRSAIVVSYFVGITLILAQGWLSDISAFKAISRLPVSLFFAFVIAEQNFANSSFYKMQRVNWLGKLGKYTYGLYLLHMFCITLVAYLTVYLGMERTLPWYYLSMIIALILSIVISMASYHLLEAPFLKLKKRFTLVRSGNQ